jgi:hypothetical protein
MSAHHKSDEILSVPVISLYHLTEKDIELIEQAIEDQDVMPFASSHPWGVFVWMPREYLEDGESAHSADFSDDFSEGFWKCFNRHFSAADGDPTDTVLIMFDEDGCELEGIPIRKD